MDVAKAYKDVEDAVNLIEDTVGPIFLLINCAGTAICGKIDEATEFDYRLVYI